MRVSQTCLLGLAAPVVAWAFLPHSIRNTPTQLSIRNIGRVQNTGDVSNSWAQENDCSFTQLNMVFNGDEPSNIFDGPMALTKERDACGVGFVANTKLGGKSR